MKVETVNPIEVKVCPLVQQQKCNWKLEEEISSFELKETFRSVEMANRVRRLTELNCG
jgi:hypothetical protein